MMKLASTPGVFLAAAFSTSLFACIIEDGPPRRLTNDRTPESSGVGSVGSSGGSSSGTSGSTTDPPGTTTSPILAVIDTDQVMTADPGQGVGVFIEYAKGGKWHIWWTCDTQQTNQDCTYAVSATASAGNIENVDSAELQGGTTSTPTASRVEARSTTTSQVHGITFHTKPGAVITVEASVGGIKDGKFLFFVQNGKVNGGFSGRVSNPLQLQGDVP